MKFIGLLLCAGLCLGSAQAQPIVGAGATFPNPLYQKWSLLAQSVGVELNYQSVGSGAGQNQIKNRTVDFGASDAPMKLQDREKFLLVQFPTVMGSLVLVVNVPGTSKNQLRLTGELVADIYLGKIKRWNDPAIVSLNPTLKMPSTFISPIYRADGSGTTYVFTNYLSNVSEDWKTKVGMATSVKWPAGSGAKGNEGVSASVKQLEGSIGYVESAYATLGNLVTTQLRNRDGNFIEASDHSVQQAAKNADWNVEGLAPDLINQPGHNSWPIVSPTYVFVPKDAKNLTGLMKFFTWALEHGDQSAIQLGYVPLPEEAKTLVKKTWRDNQLVK